MKPALAGLVLAVSACRSPEGASGPGRESLLAADRAFARAVAAARSDAAEGARLEAWVAAFDANGSTVDEAFAPVTGHAAIAERIAGFLGERANELTWEPDAAQVSEGGNLGSTTGRYEVARIAPDGRREVLERGRYFDVWRRLPDGPWKLLYDVGDPDRETEGGAGGGGE